MPHALVNELARIWVHVNGGLERASGRSVFLSNQKQDGDVAKHFTKSEVGFLCFLIGLIAP